MTWLLLSLLGCGELVEGPSEEEAPAAPVPPPKPAEEKKDDTPVDVYAYNPAGKRDPFQSFIGARTTELPGENKDAPPLQRWDVERYVLRGVIFGTDSPRALLIDPEGIGHVVKLGTYVGRNWGKVTSIADQVVVVTEEYKSIDDELVVNPVELHIGVGGAKP